MTTPDRTRLTYRYECGRAVASGVLETAGTTFLLLIAVRWYEAGAGAKALLAGGGSVGLLLGPLVVSWVGARGWATARAASWFCAAGAACFAAMAALPTLWVFVPAGMCAMAASSAIIPLMTQVYQENYPPSERGRRFARTVMIRIAAAAAFSEVAGRALSRDLGWFRLLLVAFAAAYVVAGLCLARCPSRPLVASGGTHPFRALRFAQTDLLFRHTLICWMLMGFANLMMYPLRVEYLAHPRYGLELSVGEVAMLIGVIPNLARLVMSPLWGWLFDHLNFFVLRVVLNAGFALGILTFFLSGNTAGLVAGAIIFGAANAGGDVAWGLWVTKFAPPERVADYMSVHTFFTGLRGVLAPIAAFQLAKVLPMGVLGGGCALLIVVASALLLPEARTGRAIGKGAGERVPEGAPE